MPQISVIVPVYKVEPYLRRCVDSILNQSFSDFELILVDDGSPDNCGAICDEYAQKDDRVVVIHQENGGLSAARNAGIDWAFANSDSQWLAFVDSDDWLHPQMLELLYTASDGLKTVRVCRHHYTDDDGAACLPVALNKEHCVCMDQETLLVDHWRDYNYAFGKLYPKAFFETLRYPVGKNYEDAFTTYRALYQADSICYIPCQLYFYFKNTQSITKSAWHEGFLNCFEGIREQLAFYRSHGMLRALEKETELYIEQYAYQIHRIRENDVNDPEHVHLKQMKKSMREILAQEKQFALADYPYWMEALHPHAYKGYQVIEKVKKAGILGSIRKLIGRITHKG